MTKTEHAHMLRVYKASELDLLADTIRKLNV